MVRRRTRSISATIPGRSIFSATKMIRRQCKASLPKSCSVMPRWAPWHSAVIVVGSWGVLEQKEEIQIGKVQTSVAKKLRKFATGKDGSIQKPPKNPEHERAALLLNSYISFRAKREGVAYGLNSLFFLGALDGGCREFFGVTVDRGELINDKQFPAFFKEWKNREHAH